MSPRPMFPGAETLTACAVILEGDGRPALYLSANTRDFKPRLYRLPDDTRVTLEVPHPLPTPAQEGRGHPMRGSRAVFESPSAHSVLTVSAASVARELLEALGALGVARSAQLTAARVFESVKRPPLLYHPHPPIRR